ncbi:DoxX family protein, partial [Streptomyces sp. SID11233]|nr:DoxX family protein [Streptomyces sp. SID11233]
MNIAYWTLAGLLALFYAYGGTLKAARSRDRLRPMMAWVDRVPLSVLRGLGVVEVLGAAGLVLPPLT